MLIIDCPYCGPRDQSEFSNGGEAHVKRPDGSADIGDREWGEYVFIRANPKGIKAARAALVVNQPNRFCISGKPLKANCLNFTPL